MDLVPVYADGQDGMGDDSVIKISPAVENNLGVKAAKVESVPVGSAKVIDCNCRCATCEKDSDKCLTCEANRVNKPDCECAVGYYESGCTCELCPWKCIKCTSADSC